MLLHNLMLYSTERATQLRRHIAGSGFVPCVVDPFIVAAVEELRCGGGVDGARQRAAAVNLRTALRIVCISTHKIGVLREHYASSPLLGRCLSAVLELPPPQSPARELSLLCRIACNLDSPRRSGGLLLGSALREQEEPVRREARRLFWQESSVVPVLRTSAAHQQLCLPNAMGTQPPPDAASVLSCNQGGAPTKLPPAKSQVHKEETTLRTGTSNTATKNRRKKQRKRARLRAQQAQFLLGNIDGPNRESSEPEQTETDVPSKPSPLMPYETDNGIPEELPEISDAGSEKSFRQEATVTRRILVEPQGLIADEAGNESEHSSKYSDFDIDCVMQEVADLQVSSRTDR
uniref:Uncharacterized protein n=1 Tax=Tetraselmis sp. GSL018 TaxID=582737 RepID=A0A061RM61_9CHLO